jgi:hypothetical protein
VTADYLEPEDLIWSTSKTKLDKVPVGDGTLQDLFELPVAEARELAWDAVDALPSRVRAYRLGDYIFIGAPAVNAARGIGSGASATGFDYPVLIGLPDPEVNTIDPFNGMGVLGRADGSLEPGTLWELQMSLDQANMMLQMQPGQKQSIPALPDDLSSITHGKPLTGN